jgi:DnaJ-class molecular chaperone
MMHNENYSYYSDHRVHAAYRGKWYKELNEQRQKALVQFEDMDGEGNPGEEWVNFEWDVCPTCNGKGSHVNPSIDAGGLTAEDFYEDPGFAEDYMSGMYDEPCNECKGNRVVPVTSDERVRKQIEKDDEFLCIQMAERRMGC